MTFFTELGLRNPIIHIESQNPQIEKTILSKDNKTKHFELPELKIHTKIHQSKQCGIDKSKRYQCNTIEGREENLCIYRQMIYNNNADSMH